MLTENVLKYSPAGVPDRLFLQLVFTGNYATGGDTLNLNPSAFKDPTGKGPLRGQGCGGCNPGCAPTEDKKEGPSKWQSLSYSIWPLKSKARQIKRGDCLMGPRQSGCQSLRSKITATARSPCRYGLRKIKASYETPASFNRCWSWPFLSRLRHHHAPSRASERMAAAPEPAVLFHLLGCLPVRPHAALRIRQDLHRLAGARNA